MSFFPFWVSNLSNKQDLKPSEGERKMKGRVWIIGTMMIVLVFFVGNLSWAGGRIGERQKQQHKRIAQGMRSGALTNQEYTRLSREQCRIERTKGRAWDDQRMILRERRKIHRMQDRASRHICQAKHNLKAYPGDRWTAHHRHGPPYRKRLFNAKCSTPFVSYVRGVITQPDWLFAWSVGLE